MKRLTLLCLCTLAALLAACGGGSEQEATNAAGEAMTGPEGQANTTENPTAAASIPDFESGEEAKQYLLDNFSEDKLREMYIEIIAIGKANEAFHKFRVDDGNDEEAKEIAATKATLKDSQAAFDRFGIDHSLWSVLLVVGIERNWEMEFADTISARAEEINSAR